MAKITKETMSINDLNISTQNLSIKYPNGNIPLKELRNYLLGCLAFKESNDNLNCATKANDKGISICSLQIHENSAGHAQLLVKKFMEQTDENTRKHLENNKEFKNILLWMNNPQHKKLYQYYGNINLAQKEISKFLTEATKTPQNEKLLREIQAEMWQENIGKKAFGNLEKLGLIDKDGMKNFNSSKLALAALIVNDTNQSPLRSDQITQYLLENNKIPYNYDKMLEMAKDKEKKLNKLLTGSNLANNVKECPECPSIDTNLLNSKNNIIEIKTPSNPYIVSNDNSISSVNLNRKNKII